MQVAANSVYLSGRLFDLDSVPITSKKFVINDSNENSLASGKTSKDGRFSLELPSNLINESIDLIFSLSTEKKIEEYSFIKDEPHLTKIFSFIQGPQVTLNKVYPLNIEAGKIDLGDVEMDTLTEKDDFSLSYTTDIAKTAVPAVIKALKERIKESLGFFTSQGVEGIQQDFGFEKIPLTPENIWKFITDGICPLYFKKQDDFLVADINWDTYEFDKLESLPNIKAFFRQIEGQDPRLTQIEVQFRKTLHPSNKKSDKEPLVVYVPGDENFEEGLRILGSVFHIYGQTNFHLGIGHSYGAFVAQKVYDYLEGTAFGALLLPHCEHTRTITNELGYTAIFGEDGVLNCSAKSVRGIAWRIHNTLAALDPFSYKPREPINNNHQFAKGQKIFHKALSKGVNSFINDYWTQIEKEWESIHKFFYQLHKTSPIHRDWEQEYSKMSDWHDASEIGGYVNPNAPARVKYKNSDEGVRSIRWVARDPRKPQEHDREMIAQFAIDFINRETYWHSYIHGSQYLPTRTAPNVTDLAFSPITLEKFGQGPFGGIREEDALKTEKIIQIFKNFPVENYMLLQSATVVPQVKQEIRRVAKKLLECGFDVDKELLGSVCI